MRENTSPIVTYARNLLIDTGDYPKKKITMALRADETERTNLQLESSM